MTDPRDDVPTVGAVAAQLVAREHPAAPRPAAAEARARLAELLDHDDPHTVAEGLHRLLLGRPPEDGSGAAEALAAGLPTARLAYDLLGSPESRARPLPGRDALVAEVVHRLTRSAWGVPAGVDALALLDDPDAAFVLAAYRVGHRRPPTPDELGAARKSLVAGDGREALLRRLWSDGRAEHRLFGPPPSGVRGRFGALRRRSRLPVFRAHVLAAEASATTVLGWLTELAQVSGSPSDDDLAASAAAEASTSAAAAEARLQGARLAEVAAGLRALTGTAPW